MNKKQKQNKKKGHVIRVSGSTMTYLNDHKAPKESFSKLLERILTNSGKNTDPLWVLMNPKVRAFSTLGEAVGESIMRQVRMKKKRRETPRKFIEVKK